MFARRWCRTASWAAALTLMLSAWCSHGAQAADLFVLARFFEPDSNQAALVLQLNGEVDGTGFAAASGIAAFTGSEGADQVVTEGVLSGGELTLVLAGEGPADGAIVLIDLVTEEAFFVGADTLLDGTATVHIRKDSGGDNEPK